MNGRAGGIEEGSVTLEPCTQFVDEWVTVCEGDIAKAMVNMYTHHGHMFEGAAGVAVAAFLQKASEMHGKHCVVVCCGGNVSRETMDRAYRLAGLAR
jgi:threonine dehydratase